MEVACYQNRSSWLCCNFAFNGLKDFVGEGCLRLNFMAIGEAVNALGTEDPTCFRAA